MAHVIIIDDDPTFRVLLSDHAILLGHEATSAASIEAGKALLAKQPCELVFLDVRLPDGNGLDVLPYMQSLPSAPEVIIITGMGDANGAELAIRSGAWDYLQNPFPIRKSSCISAGLSNITRKRCSARPGSTSNATRLSARAGRFVIAWIRSPNAPGPTLAC